VYAECGGLMYLGKELIVEGKAFPMASVFPFCFHIEGTPQGHGYTILEADTPNPYFPTGEILHGHEFHYSHIPDFEEGSYTCAFQVRRGQGIHGRRDGLCHKNVLATYSHLHAAGAKGWAGALSGQAVSYQRRREFSEPGNEASAVTDMGGRQDACSCRG
jgi:cobyrinic acid a,c-diamide synthase